MSKKYQNQSTNNIIRGFTLIELLAVIVILAIISLIATPMVLKYIETTKSSAKVDSAYAYVRNLEAEIVSSILKGDTISSGLRSTNELKEMDIKVKGDNPDDVKVCISNVGQVEKGIFKYDEYYVSYGDSIAEISSAEEFVNFQCETAFATDDCNTIIENVKNGNTNKYNIGDTKEIILTGEEAGTYKVRIANKSTPEECNTTGFSKTACGFVIEFEDIVIESMDLMAPNGYDRGWSGSALRNYVNETLFNALPENLKTGIIDTNVVSVITDEDDNTTTTTTTDKLYLLTLSEVFSDYASSSVVATRQLDYYKNKDVTSFPSSYVIKKYKGIGSAWWLLDEETGIAVLSDGSIKPSIHSNSLGVAPAFRIG